MIVSDELHNRESQTTPITIGSRASVKRLEDCIEVAGCYSWAGVFDSQKATLAVMENAYIDLAAIRRIPDRIVDKVANHHRHGRRVGTHRCRLQTAETEVDGARSRVR